MTLCRYVTGWLNDFGIRHTDNQVVALAEWVRRRVRLYYTGQKPGSDRTRRMRTRAYGGVAAGDGLLGQSSASRFFSL